MLPNWAFPPNPKLMVPQSTSAITAPIAKQEDRTSKENALGDGGGNLHPRFALLGSKLRHLLLALGVETNLVVDHLADADLGSGRAVEGKTEQGCK